MDVTLLSLNNIMLLKIRCVGPNQAQKKHKEIKKKSKTKLKTHTQIIFEILFLITFIPNYITFMCDKCMCILDMLLIR